MIIVTGGAGFIGSNLVHTLNALGRDDIIVVDDLTNGHQFVNLQGARFYDYLDKDDFLNRIKLNDRFADKVEAVLHQGACSTTTEWDGKYMMANNYEYSKQLLQYCLKWGIAFIYASSAAVYGAHDTFRETPDYEAPLNVYGYSKLCFDNWVRQLRKDAHSQIVGLRYFNVYGPREQHKGAMASVFHHFREQLKTQKTVRLFEGCEGYADGEQRRDFVFVDDVVNVNLWFLQNPDRSGIFNVGTGCSQTFNDVAHAVIDKMGYGEIEYIPFPEHLRGAYQSYTQADLTALRACGYDQAFRSVHADW